MRRLAGLHMVAVAALLAGTGAVAEVPDTAELFVVANEAAGIDAPHRSSWAEFVHHTFNSGYLGIGQAWGDYDNDGWVDLFLAASGYGERFQASTASVGLLFPHSNVLFRNRGYGNYVDATPPSWQERPKPSMGVYSRRWRRIRAKIFCAPTCFVVMPTWAPQTSQGWPPLAPNSHGLTPRYSACS